MPAASKERILIVDDQKDICELLSRYLTAEGYMCATAHSGEMALKMIEDEHFDHVLSDIMMPGMSGIDLLNIVKTLFPEVAMFMVTAVDDKATGLLAVELGAVGYMCCFRQIKRKKVLVVDYLLRDWSEASAPVPA